MYRYFALIWNEEDASARAAAALLAARLRCASGEWHLLLDLPSLTAFHSTDGSGSCETQILDDGKGLVFGRLFRREADPQSASAAVDKAESERIASTRGSELIDRYWGRYVAVIRDGQRGEVCVVRDPTAGLPCFVTCYRDVSIVFSDVEACLSLDMLGFTINWKYVTAFMPYAALQTRETGLNEVSEVQAGERVVFARDSTQRISLWNPADIARSLPIENPDEAARALRRQVKACVETWASVHGALIHNLSGGLDSSIVLSCLKGASTQRPVTCLHFFAPATNEDERKYARLAAQHMNAELIECAIDPTAVRLDRMLQIRFAPKPWFYAYDLQHSQTEARVAREKGATGIVSGSGGDGVFHQSAADLAVTDYLYRRRFPNQLLKVALYAARITRSSLWPVLGHGVARRFRSASRSPLAQSNDELTLIPPAVIEAARSDSGLLHPWLSEAGTLPPGLACHILSLTVPPPFYESFGGQQEIERTLVLLSQPIIELCLRIPSYVWIAGGRDRAVARRAFARDLPAEIVRRQSKGAIDRHNRVLLDANEAFLREMLMDGLLVQRGLINRDRLDIYLSRNRLPADYEYNEILQQHLCTEVWLRRWSERERRSATIA